MLLTVTVGVLHQIGPAAMGIAPRHSGAWRALLPVLLLGTSAVVAGSVSGTAHLLHAGWGLVTIATSAYAWVLLGPSRASTGGRAVARRISTAFLALGGTLALAAARLALGRLGITADLDVLRLGHIALGVGGFGTLLGIGVALQLFPGFFGARDASVRSGQVAVRLVTVGVGAVSLTALADLGASCAWSTLRQLGIVTTSMGGLAFVWQTAHWWRARRDRPLDATLVGATIAVLALGAASAIGIAAVVVPSARATLITSWGLLMIPGWITLLIVSVLLRVVPLMSWLERFGSLDPSARRRVRVAQLIRTRSAWTAIIATFAGVVLLVATSVSGAVWIGYLGAGGLGVGSCALIHQILAAWFGRPLPDATPPAVPNPH